MRRTAPNTKRLRKLTEAMRHAFQPHDVATAPQFYEIASILDSLLTEVDELRDKVAELENAMEDMKCE